MPIDRHHILARSNSGTNHPDNIVRLNVKEHRNIHNLFGNLQPHEQINKILAISDTVWLPDQLNAIDELIRSFKGEYYKHHCLRQRGTKFTKTGYLFTPDYEG